MFSFQSLVLLTFVLFANTPITHSVDIVTCDGSCHCPQYAHCRMGCIGYKQCEGSDTTVTCKSGYPCTIKCQGTRACRSATINANGATKLKLMCEGNKSCQYTVVNCNNTDNCDIICSDSLACQYMNLDCDTSICSIDCQTFDSKTCDQLNVNAADATSFECRNDCPHTIPSPFKPTTMQPTTSTNYPTTSSSTTQYQQTTIDSQITSRAEPIHSTTQSISSSTASHQQTTSIHPQITLQSVTETLFTSVSSTDSDNTELVTTNSIIPPIHASTPLLSDELFVSTDDNIDLFMTEQQEAEQEELTTTTLSDDDSDITLQNGIMGQLIFDDIWIYIVICGAACCCFLIALMYVIGHRKKSGKEVFKKEIYIPNHYAKQKAIPSSTVTTTPVSYSVSSVALTSATMTPVTPVKIRNLSVIKDDILYTNSFPGTVNSRFSVYLANEVLAGSMMIDDIVNDMVSTPGQCDDVDDIDNMEMDVAIDVNPMKEGDSRDALYANGNALLNDNAASDDDDDILEVVNETADGMGITEGETVNDECDDIDVDKIVITDFGENNDIDDEIHHGDTIH